MGQRPLPEWSQILIWLVEQICSKSNSRSEALRIGVPNYLRASLIGIFRVWKTEVADLAQVELAHTQIILS